MSQNYETEEPANQQEPISADNDRWPELTELEQQFLATSCNGLAGQGTDSAETDPAETDSTESVLCGLIQQKPVDKREVPLSKNVEAWQELVDVKQLLIDKLIASSQKRYCPEDQECQDLIHTVTDLFNKSNMLAGQLQETNSTESNPTEVPCGVEQEPSDDQQEPEALRAIKQKVEELDKQFRDWMAAPKGSSVPQDPTRSEQMAQLQRRINDELKNLKENQLHLEISLENHKLLLAELRGTQQRSASANNPGPDPNFLVQFELHHLEEQRMSLLSQLVERQHANLNKLVQQYKQLKDL